MYSMISKTTIDKYCQYDDKPIRIGGYSAMIKFIESCGVITEEEFIDQVNAGGIRIIKRGNVYYNACYC